MSSSPIKTVSGNIRNILAAYCTTLPARRDQDIRIKCYHRKSGPVLCSLLSLLKDKHCVICFACYLLHCTAKVVIMGDVRDYLRGTSRSEMHVSNGLSYHTCWCDPWPGQCQAGSGVPIKCRGEELVLICVVITPVSSVSRQRVRTNLWPGVTRPITQCLATRPFKLQQHLHV